VLKHAGPVGLVVPLFGIPGVLATSEYLAALERFPALELLLVGQPSEAAAARALQGRFPARVRLQIRPGLLESQAVQQGMLQLLDAGLPFVGYWGADVEVPLELSREWQTTLVGSDALMVFGSRLRLLQHDHPGLWQRHYVGRVLASAVSFVLGLQIYDTECCAKLFKNVPLVRSLFETPFETKVCYNAEVFVRLLELRGHHPSFDIERACVEFPLPTWSARTRPRYGLVHLAQRATDLLLLGRRVRASSSPVTSR
jgi:hypothetical protein